MSKLRNSHGISNPDFSPDRPAWRRIFPAPALPPRTPLRLRQIRTSSIVEITDGDLLYLALTELLEEFGESRFRAEVGAVVADRVRQTRRAGR